MRPIPVPATLSRRELLALTPAALLALGLRPALAAEPIGHAVMVRGGAALRRADEQNRLAVDDALLVDDLVLTASDGFAQLKLLPDTVVNLGNDAQLLIDTFLASQGGVLQLGNGALLFDRPEGAAEEDVTVKTAFAMIGVRGTKFFAGPSNGVFGIFCERGEVRVLAAGEVRLLHGGDGVDIPSPGAPPSAVKQWGPPRIAAAYASVGAAVG